MAQPRFQTFSQRSAKALWLLTLAQELQHAQCFQETIINRPPKVRAAQGLKTATTRANNVAKGATGVSSAAPLGPFPPFTAQSNLGWIPPF